MKCCKKAEKNGLIGCRYAKKIMTEALFLFDAFADRVSQLISAARKSHIEVVYIRHDDGEELTRGEEGFDIFDKFAPTSDEKIFDKNFNSAFKNTGLKEYLTKKNETCVMIVGIQTDYCIDATIKCGFEHGFKMIVPQMCNTTIDNDFMTAEQTYKYYNCKMWQNRYAECVSFENALSLLAKDMCI